MKLISGNCGKVSNKKHAMDIRADSYLFVSPEAIWALAGSFIQESKEYDQLVDQLVKALDDEPLDPDPEPTE
jgi:hypothetical protein